MTASPPAEAMDGVNGRASDGSLILYGQAGDENIRTWSSIRQIRKTKETLEQVNYMEFKLRTCTILHILCTKSAK